MSTAYSYIRFSSTRQEEGDSLRRQIEAASKYAEQNNLSLDTTLNLRDLGVSAFTVRTARDRKLILNRYRVTTNLPPAESSTTQL